MSSNRIRKNNKKNNKESSGQDQKLDLQKANLEKQHKLFMSIAMF